LLQQYEAAQLMAIFPDYRPQETTLEREIEGCIYPLMDQGFLLLQ
jgi:hypothetical protein